MTKNASPLANPNITKVVNPSLLREILVCHPESGALLWTSFAGSRCVAGKIAGSLPAGPKSLRTISISGVKYQATRLAWVIHTGKNPDGLVVTRVFDNYARKNLEVIDRKELNSRRVERFDSARKRYNTRLSLRMQRILLRCIDPGASRRVQRNALTSLQKVFIKHLSQREEDFLRQLNSIGKRQVPATDQPSRDTACIVGEILNVKITVNKQGTVFRASQRDLELAVEMTDQVLHAIRKLVEENSEVTHQQLNVMLTSATEGLVGNEVEGR